jgi:hypothetical protein
MAHINSLTTVMFSDMAVTAHGVTLAEFNTATAGADAAVIATKLGKYFDAFGTTVDYTLDTPAIAGEYARIENVKEFPAFGTPANIVKVPEYGSKTSKQVQGQADSPNMELTLNYIPSAWEDNKLRKTGGLAAGPAINDQTLYLFRFALLGASPTGGTYTTADLSTTKNSVFYFVGKFEALEVTPSLTDALTAKLTISVQSEVKGAYTH